MDFYQSLGSLILGSRLRRISEYYLSEVNHVYQELGIDFEASWFPIFYILSKKEGEDKISMRELSNQLQVSHSAVSQLVASLKRKNLIETKASSADARVQQIELTTEGQHLLKSIEPIWAALEQSMTALSAQDEQVAKLLDSMTALEQGFENERLADRILKRLRVEAQDTDTTCNLDKQHMNNTFKYGVERLTIAKTIALTTGKLKGVLVPEAIQKIEKSAANVAGIVANTKIVYGINTGFGPLCDTIISASETSKLQHNLLMSHAVGVGKAIAPEIAKSMMIIKVQALVQGFSGIRLETVERIMKMIDLDMIPVVPEQGSVGASGDLAPLSHLFLPLIGLGEVFFQGQRMETAEALQRAGLKALELGPKEGLGLINGTQFIAAHAVHGVQRMYNVLEAADLIGALSLEGMMGSYQPFDPRLHEIRPFPGNQLVAARLWNLLKPSTLANSHPDCGRVQDPYSLRCMPQVHGASRTAWKHLKELVEIEINAVTDNPIVLGPDDTISGGNFHGQPLAMAIDYATLASAEIGNISDRRSYLIIEGRYGLPKLLIEDAGLNSGFMIPQYTAAALVSENKGLCFPASADSIPTSLGQEDHVSMGSIGGRKLNQVISNLENILAVELLYAAQAVDFRRPLQTSAVLEACHSYVRECVPFADKDRVFSNDINALNEIIKNGSFVAKANEAAKQFDQTLTPDTYESFKLS